jgi:hypothetical protein
VTFNPRSSGRPHPIAVAQGLAGPIACPAVSQCTATSDAGSETNEVTFDPRSPGRPKLAAIDSANQLTGLACPTVSVCVAVDAGGDVLEGDPASAAPWTPERIAGADSLTSVSCAAVWQCVAVDIVGHAFVGIAPPRLSDVRQSHRSWRERSRLKRRQSRRSAPAGTVFSFALSQPARIIFKFTKTVRGRRSGRRCLAVTGHRRPDRRCLRTIVLGTLSSSRTQGRDKLSFDGRLSPTHTLGPGRYTVLTMAINATGERSQQHSLTFTILS